MTYLVVGAEEWWSSVLEEASVTGEDHDEHLAEGVEPVLLQSSASVARLGSGEGQGSEGSVG